MKIAIVHDRLTVYAVAERVRAGTDISKDMIANGTHLLADF